MLTEDPVESCFVSIRCHCHIKLNLHLFRKIRVNFGPPMCRFARMVTSSIQDKNDRRLGKELYNDTLATSDIIAVPEGDK